MTGSAQSTRIDTPCKKKCMAVQPAKNRPESERMSDAILDSLGPVVPDPGCIVPDDPGEVVRHAAPLDDRARAELREQQIARLRYDSQAVAARERRIAIARGQVTDIRRRRA